MTEHEPDARWNCKACGNPWLCELARTHMLATMTPTELAVRQWTILEQAVVDLQPMTSKEAWDRFLGWSRGPVR